MDDATKYRLLVVAGWLLLLLAVCASPQAHRGTQPAISATAPAVPPTVPTADSTCTVSGGRAWYGATHVRAVIASDDTFTLTFDGDVPAFRTQVQQSPHFVQEPSGVPVTLAGSDGLLITFSGLAADAYGGLPNSFSTGGPLLLEVRNLQDFEGVVQFGAGLSEAGCASAQVSGSTVTFHFLRPGKA